MNYSRRNFLATSGAASAATFFVPSLLIADDEDDVVESNEIVDRDGEIGKPYRGWIEGEYDIHFIHTGSAENCFQIYPDGTTAIFDCGECDLRHFGKVSWNPTKRDDAACAPMPDGSRMSSEWVARYIERLLPELKTIDYALASHFHDDHVGSCNYGLGMTTGRGDDYQLSGLSNLGEKYRFGKAFDRGYPTYDQPYPEAPKDRENLRKFWEYKEKTDGLKREEFIVGALDQIRLVNSPDKYDFHVRNICRNGVVWTGRGNEVFDTFGLYPKNKETLKNENFNSLATVTQFGAFRFYTGGDVCVGGKDAEGRDIDYEGRVGRAVGPVDVCKTNHHASHGSMTRSFVDAVQARVYVTCCWWKGHFNDHTTPIMCAEKDDYVGPRLLCPTDPHPQNADLIKDAPFRSNVDQNVGHVVVKAYDGGAKYKVYRLTAKDESMTVDNVFGPFRSKGAQG